MYLVEVFLNAISITMFRLKSGVLSLLIQDADVYVGIEEEQVSDH